ncbi:MAG: Sapep family Mn(2+)-dependent dipeptidase [Oscillospiraceae bacterium]|nr:Sapep family Mn(2+)-dependent dipeptidase [Oscillospiraceae bacterium]
MELQAQIDAYFQDKRALLIQGVSRLVSIPSVRGEARPGAPFGEGPDRALKEALALAGELGLKAGNYEGYVGTVDLNDRETALHILCHLDVVDPGAGWTVTEPFSPVERDGTLYGRGVADDKGPAVASLLAMACLRDLNVPLTRNARLLLGTDEESGSRDIAYYYQHEDFAPCAFSPDGEFPVIHIEKGRYAPTFSRQWEPDGGLPRLVSFQGGVRPNVLPADAEAVIEGLPMHLLMPRAQLGTRITGAEYRLSPAGPNRIRIFAHGRGCHASTPEQGLNGITALLELLGVLPFAESESKNALHALLDLLPHRDTTGKGLGIAMSDQDSGALTLSLSLLEFTESGVTGTLDCRTPLCADERNCRRRAEKAFADKGFSCQGEMAPPHHTSAGSPFVQTLLDCYRSYTGQPGECIAIGGGTYVHNIPGGVAFGPVMPGFETNMHGPDERIGVSDLLTAAKIYALAIARLCT